MPDAPDPLGKRALFWAPAERHEDGPRNAEEGAITGKRALFSDGGSPTSPRPRPGGRAPASERGAEGASTAAGSGPIVQPRQKAPAPPPAQANRGPRTGERPRVGGGGMFTTFTLDCSSCRVRTQVDLVEYLALHLPVWLWRPGRGYTRFMVCPACRRRTWVSASWARRAR